MDLGHSTGDTFFEGRDLDFFCGLILSHERKCPMAKKTAKKKAVKKVAKKVSKKKGSGPTFGSARTGNAG